MNYFCRTIDDYGDYCFRQVSQRSYISLVFLFLFQVYFYFPALDAFSFQDIGNIDREFLHGKNISFILNFLSLLTFYMTVRRLLNREIAFITSLFALLFSGALFLDSVLSLLLFSSLVPIYVISCLWAHSLLGRECIFSRKYAFLFFLGSLLLLFLSHVFFTGIVLLILMLCYSKHSLAWLKPIGGRYFLAFLMLVAIGDIFLSFPLYQTQLYGIVDFIAHNDISRLTIYNPVILLLPFSLYILYQERQDERIAFIGKVLLIVLLFSPMVLIFPLFLSFALIGYFFYISSDQEWSLINFLASILGCVLFILSFWTFFIDVPLTINILFIAVYGIAYCGVLLFFLRRYHYAMLLMIIIAEILMYLPILLDN